MKSNEITARIASLTNDQKAELLAAVAHFLTITARGAYPGVDTPDGSFGRLMAFNETLHHLTSQIGSLTKHHPLYPDDVFIQLLFEDAARGDCEQSLTRAFEQALARSSAA
jgi:hypothetical protein